VIDANLLVFGTSSYFATLGTNIEFIGLSSRDVQNCRHCAYIMLSL